MFVPKRQDNQLARITPPAGDWSPAIDGVEVDQLIAILSSRSMNDSQIHELRKIALKASQKNFSNHLNELGITVREISPNLVIPGHDINDERKLKSLEIAVSQGFSIPPIIVYDGGHEKYLILEGHHRLQAHMNLDQNIQAILIRSDRELIKLIAAKRNEGVYIGWLSRFEKSASPLSDAIQTIKDHGSWPEDLKEVAGNIISQQESVKLFQRNFGPGQGSIEFNEPKFHQESVQEIYVDLNEGSIKFFGSDLQKLSDRMSELGFDAADLRTLELGNPQISDLRLLSRFKQLDYLRIEDSPLVRDISPIAELLELKELHLVDTGVEDISDLSGLNKLKTLNLWHTPVEDISPIADLSELEHLDLTVTEVNDIKALATLNKLKYLSLSCSLARDIGPLSTVTSLESLDLSFLHTLDLLPLRSLVNLRELTLREVDTSSIDQLIAAIKEKGGRVHR
jgi:Leucine-rich repeat (LRR) protein